MEPGIGWLYGDVTGTTIDSTTPLTAADRCDRCGAQAYVRVVLPVGELLFCAHHGHAHRDALERQALFIQDESDRLTNAVFMGMGEPLDNYDNVMRAIEILTADWGFAWSPKRITVSTIGVMPNLKRYLDECRCHLAVSLHDPFGPERLSIMPVQKAGPIQEVIDLIKQYDFSGQRRVSRMQKQKK